MLRSGSFCSLRRCLCLFSKSTLKLISCSGKVHWCGMGTFGGVSVLKPWCECNWENPFCVTDVGQAYLSWLPVNALVHLRGVAIGLEKPALAVKDRSWTSESVSGLPFQE